MELDGSSTFLSGTVCDSQTVKKCITYLCTLVPLEMLESKMNWLDFGGQRLVSLWSMSPSDGQGIVKKSLGAFFKVAVHLLALKVLAGYTGRQRWKVRVTMIICTPYSHERDISKMPEGPFLNLVWRYLELNDKVVVGYQCYDRCMTPHVPPHRRLPPQYFWFWVTWSELF